MFAVNGVSWPVPSRKEKEQKKTENYSLLYVLHVVYTYIYPNSKCFKLFALICRKVSYI